MNRPPQEKGRINPELCNHCGLFCTKEGHDGCLGELNPKEVMNACCGHGETRMAYVQFWNRERVVGNEAMAYIYENNHERSE